MEASFEALQVFVILIPGFLASTVLNAIVVKPQDGFSRMIEATVLSFIVYGIVSGIFGVAPLARVTRAVQVHQVLQTDSLQTIPRVSQFVGVTDGINPPFVLVALVTALVIALLLGVANTGDYHMRLLRRMHISSKTARETMSATSS